MKKPASRIHPDTTSKSGREQQHGLLSRWGWIVLALTAVGLLLASWSLSGVGKSAASTDAPAVAAPQARYVGGQACASCHAAEFKDWTGSDHDLAMQHVSDKSVLGDFNGARFSYAGITSSFFKRDGKFFVRTDGPDGKLADFQIQYVFGVTPLQQYLIGLPRGRLQALSIAWDSRPREAGGQRWFHMYPEREGGLQGCAALDAPFAELEPHVRRVPLDRPAQEL